MGYSQQDAQEFLRYLLEGLHEDVNRVTVKPKPILTEIDDNLSDTAKAAEAWSRYLRAEDSRIMYDNRFCFAAVGHWMGGQKLLSGVPPCFGRHVKPLVPAASAVVSTRQSALGPRGGSWPNLPITPIGKACAPAVGTLIG
ncbi:hypothetical protein evm_015409 [Chilo suppressalis]|nr:hypothetical protein evm_015409 [Chilo suppressalis]